MLRARPVGSVLVGDRAAIGASNPEGFLRKVVSVAQAADKTVVITDHATLLDAAPSIDFWRHGERVDHGGLQL